MSWGAPGIHQVSHHIYGRPLCHGCAIIRLQRQGDTINRFIIKRASGSLTPTLSPPHGIALPSPGLEPVDPGNANTIHPHPDHKIKANHLLSHLQSQFPRPCNFGPFLISDFCLHLWEFLPPRKCYWFLGTESGVLGANICGLPQEIAFSWTWLIYYLQQFPFHFHLPAIPHDYCCCLPFAGGVFPLLILFFCFGFCCCVSREVKIKSPNTKMLSYETYGRNFCPTSVVFGFYFFGFCCLQVSGFWELANRYYELILGIIFLLNELLLSLGRYF